MAQKITVQLIDDLDGGDASESITFSIDGAAYEIDLNEENAKEFRDNLAPYIKAGRRVRATAKRRASRPGVSRPDIADIRQWAKSNGYSLADRGRIPRNIIEAYDARSA